MDVNFLTAWYSTQRRDVAPIQFAFGIRFFSGSTSRSREIALRYGFAQ